MNEIRGEMIVAAFSMTYLGGQIMAKVPLLTAFFIAELYSVVATAERASRSNEPSAGAAQKKPPNGGCVTAARAPHLVFEGLGVDQLRPPQSSPPLSPPLNMVNFRAVAFLAALALPLSASPVKHQERVGEYLPSHAMT